MKNSIDKEKIWSHLYLTKAMQSWAGDGEIELMWIPPFMFKGVRTEEFTVGVTIWHVKQREDGFPWILSPIELPCEGGFE